MIDPFTFQSRGISQSDWVLTKKRTKEKTENRTFIITFAHSFYSEPKNIRRSL